MAEYDFNVVALTLVASQTGIWYFNSAPSHFLFLLLNKKVHYQNDLSIGMLSMYFLFTAFSPVYKHLHTKTYLPFISVDNGIQLQCSVLGGLFSTFMCVPGVAKKKKKLKRQVPALLCIQAQERWPQAKEFTTAEHVHMCSQNSHKNLLLF